MDTAKAPASQPMHHLLARLVQALDLLHPRHEPEGNEDCFINTVRREAEETMAGLAQDPTLHCPGCTGTTPTLPEGRTGDRHRTQGQACPGVTLDLHARTDHA